MELRHLRYFVAVAEKLSFRAAADVLHVSHPALSKQIKDLEHELGVKLLERNTVNVWLTESGRRLLDDARDILARVDVAVNATRAATGDLLLLGSPGCFWASYLQDVLKILRRSHPGVDIRIVERLPWEQVAALNRGEIQLGFVSKRDLSKAKSVESEYLLKSEYGVILGVEHPLASRKELGWEDIRGENLFIFGKGRRSRQMQDIRLMLPGARFDKERLKSVERIESMTTLLVSGQGISILPEVFAREMTGVLRYVPLRGGGPKVHFEMWLMWRSGDTSQTLKDFIALMREEIRREESLSVVQAVRAEADVCENVPA
jgi:DNA-binding transcriptional LysR family regulator